jgi:uncharacterized protein (DUF362 family)
MRRLIEADHVINVPTCKNHEWAVFSASMKNFIGAIGDDSRDPLHYDLGSPEQLSRDIALLNQGFAPLLNIVDARAVMINGGPGGGGSDAIRIQRDMIIAGRDRVAVDAACVALMQLELSRTEVPEPDASNAYLMGFWAWQMPQIVEAIERGLGASSAEQVALRFEGIDDAAEIDEYFRA